MELPHHLKTLYRHWPQHIGEQEQRISGLSPEIDAFIAERTRIWERKTTGEHPPYTDDPILARYRFCNILRECDRQTIFFHTLLNPLRDTFPLWLLNMFYCRMVARPETITAVGLLSFNEKENTALYARFMTLPRPRYGTPYVFPVSVIQRSTTPTRERFIACHLPRVMQRIADEITTWHHESVYDGVQKIIPLFGFNLTFLWTEVLIDVAYQFPEHVDLFKRFPIGPGSRPTFVRYAPEQDPSLYVTELAARDVTISITYNDKPIHLSAENWEGIGCEFRKYTNLKNHTGRKRIYTL